MVNQCCLVGGIPFHPSAWEKKGVVYYSLEEKTTLLLNWHKQLYWSLVNWQCITSGIARSFCALVPDTIYMCWSIPVQIYLNNSGISKVLLHMEHQLKWYYSLCFYNYLSLQYVYNQPLLSYRAMLFKRWEMARQVTWYQPSEFVAGPE